ncbi:MAG: hypothetical protein M3209_10985 [Acidobacteriota bacterium]|nr:hypothetical protein [Acidobacteriota bacterium]
MPQEVVKTSKLKTANIILTCVLAVSLGFNIFHFISDSIKGKQTEEERLRAAISEIEQEFQPSREDALHKLEIDLKQREIEVAKLPRRLDTSQWQARIEELKIESEGLRKRLELEQKYYSDIAERADNEKLREEIQRTIGRQFETKSLETNKRLAEIERESKDLNLKIEEDEINRKYALKKSLLDSQYAERMAKLLSGNLDESTDHKKNKK